MIIFRFHCLANLSFSVESSESKQCIIFMRHLVSPRNSFLVMGKPCTIRSTLAPLPCKVSTPKTFSSSRYPISWSLRETETFSSVRIRQYPALFAWLSMHNGSTLPLSMLDVAIAILAHHNKAPLLGHTKHPNTINMKFLSNS